MKLQSFLDASSHHTRTTDSGSVSFSTNNISAAFRIFCRTQLIFHTISHFCIQSAFIMYPDYFYVFEKLHFEGSKCLPRGAWWKLPPVMTDRILMSNCGSVQVKLIRWLSHWNITQWQNFMLLYVVWRHVVCVVKKEFLVQNVKINIVFNVNLFWLIQECKVCCQKCHLEQGALCDYGESCESCQVLQLPFPSAYCYEALFYFKGSVSNLSCSTVSFSILI